MADGAIPQHNAGLAAAVGGPKERGGTPDAPRAGASQEHGECGDAESTGPRDARRSQGVAEPGRVGREAAAGAWASDGAADIATARLCQGARSPV